MPATIFDSAESFDRAYASRGLWGEWLRSRLAEVVDLVGDGPGEVLDAGMGPGRLVEQLERRGWTAWGIDASARMAALARERAPGARERILVGRLEQLPFGDASFDAAVAVGVIDHVADPEGVVRELARVLRPGGLLVIGAGNARSPFRLWRDLVVRPAARLFDRHRSLSRRRPLRLPFVSRRHAERLLRAAGLRPEGIRLTAYTLLPDPVDRILPDVSERLGRFAARQGPLVRSLAATQVLIEAVKIGPGVKAGRGR
jgi:SAM-dependent methyltransferase